MASITQNNLKAQVLKDLQNPNVKAWLHVLGKTEGTEFYATKKNTSAYKINIGGGINKNYPHHPGTKTIASNSDASGRYQFLFTTWEACRKALGLEDMSPLNQDLAAAYLIGKGQCNAMNDLKNGDMVKVFDKTAKCWASIPVHTPQYQILKGGKRGPWRKHDDSYYGQPSHMSIVEITNYYKSKGGSVFFFPTQQQQQRTNQQNPVTGFFPYLLSLFSSSKNS